MDLQQHVAYCRVALPAFQARHHMLNVPGALLVETESQNRVECKNFTEAVHRAYTVVYMHPGLG